MRYQTATETVQYPSDGTTDTPGANNTSGFAAQFESQQSLQGKISVAHPIVSLRARAGYLSIPRVYPTCILAFHHFSGVT